MRLIVHIGYNKTGTSSIQSYCFEHAEALRRDGLCYSTIGTHDNAHYVVSKLFIGAPSSEAVNTPPDLMERFREDFERSGCESLLLSSEYLVLANHIHIQAIRDALYKYFQVDECKIVVYLRRHDLWFESLFNQAVKNVDSPPWELDIKDYVIQSLGGAGNRPHYFTVLEHWAKEFGKDAMIVRPFETAQFVGGSLISDFFAHAFPQHKAGFETSDIRTNVSVSPNKLYMIGLLRRWPKSPERDTAINKMLNAPDTSETAFPADFGVLTKKQRRGIVRFFEPEYARIAKKYLKRSNGKLFMEEV